LKKLIIVARSYNDICGGNCFFDLRRNIASFCQNHRAIGAALCAHLDCDDGESGYAFRTSKAFRCSFDVP